MKVDLAHALDLRLTDCGLLLSFQHSADRRNHIGKGHQPESSFRIAVSQRVKSQRGHGCNHPNEKHWLTWCMSFHGDVHIPAPLRKIVGTELTRRINRSESQIAYRVKRAEVAA